MNSYETVETYQYYYKKKIVILGGLEKTKDKFQKVLSSNCLPLENKENIGVNISKIDYYYKPRQKFEYLLWNIDCGQRRAFLRTIFYSGADAMVIFISEDKPNQIEQYFDELQSILPEISLIFCIILEKRSKEDLISSYIKTEKFRSMAKNYQFKIKEISEPIEIINQISSILKKKAKNKEVENRYLIDFITHSSLFTHNNIMDECNDYFEPESHAITSHNIINTDLLTEYIQTLDLDINFESHNWIKIKNKNFGTFSIYLKNGNVYYFPKRCKKCNDKKCLKFKRAPYYVCIEAGDSDGWTNINGFNQNELLILTKIYALKEGNEYNLPKSVLKQIKNISKCNYGNKRK